VLGNVVRATTPDAAFGIVLLSAEQNLVAFNRVVGFEGEIPDLGGGGIAVIQDSSNNVILGNFVQSNPDLFGDETGRRNRWIANACDTSAPDGLCR
jgi:hypothetical protein